MTSNEEIILDSGSGISIEEQREILSQINGIAEKNRRSLLEAAASIQDEKKIKINAKKKGIFPLVVNIAALLILAGGGLSLYLVNSKKEHQIREGSGVFSITEQALIGELTAAQQEAYSTLQQLATEQERAAAIDSYISGAITKISELILSDEFDLAAISIKELQNFIHTPSFEANRAFISRKEFYIQSINSLEKLIDDIRKSGYSYVMALEARNSHLENTVETMDNTINSLTSRNTEQASRIIQLQDTVTEKDRSISSLETEKNTLNQNVSSLQNTNTQQQNEIVQLNDQLTNIRQALQALSQ
ncbi:MAG: hypothetical protein LBU88_09475 [Treponema sp.]|jgi:chromosome segregation ATPase|nr:hypothetical protein [Treponema sp.]